MVRVKMAGGSCIVPLNVLTKMEVQGCVCV